MRTPDSSLNHRLTGALYFLLPLLAAGFLLRLAFIWRTWAELPHGPSLLGALLVGVFADLVYSSYFLLPVALYLTIVPQRVFRHPVHHFLTLLALSFTTWIVLFNVVAEWIFWDEFGVRFNFIAVDYLVYTTEVVDNILESYPVYPILASLAVIAAAIAYACTRLRPYRRWLHASTPALSRFGAFTIACLIPLVATAAVSAHNLPEFGNRYVQEISRNGPYSFFAAFRDNEIDYHAFYIDEAPELAARRIRPLIEQADAIFPPASAVPEHRLISHIGEEKHYNVIQIVIESLSAEFLGTFGNADGLTPTLDEIAEQSLLFTNLMATGTRTVRGMESLTLSVPPTPGRSIVKRPHNDVLFSTGTVLHDKGYRPAFFYGGYGYFDNMNDFFAGNGFEIHDRASDATEDVIFTNAWGVSDEDLYGWVLEDADRQFATGQPFFDFVMTTSNHRPYTYPQGRIDIPSHTGRAGAVKYTDYAIGQFLEAARRKPWFDDTIFIIVADHCANSAGKTVLPTKNYRIPMMIYAPGFVESRRIDTLGSQIDLAPTLFALLNWTYETEFFGKDLLQENAGEGRALIGTYQSLGYLQSDGLLTVLTPGRSSESFRFDAQSGGQQRVSVRPSNLLDTVTVYQRAADLFRDRSSLDGA